MSEIPERNVRALALLRRWRDAALDDDAGSLGDLTADTTDVLDGLEPVSMGEPGTLDEAWAEVEAALPEAYELHVWTSPHGSGYTSAAAVPLPGGYRRNRIERIGASSKDCPIAALQELARLLKEQSEPS